MSDTPEDSSFRTDPLDPDALDRTVAAAAMRLAAEKGWRRVGLLDVAKAAGVPLSRFHHRFRGRADLLAAVSRVADATVLAADLTPDPAEAERDRLFDVMMRRFDALRPYREGLRAVIRDLPTEPVTSLAFSCSFGRSMAWMLRAAGIDPDRRGGAALVAGLGTVHARVMRVFLDDDSADLSRTMAALDNALRGAERWGATFCRWTGRRRAAAENPTASAA
ncbi:TetR family transcriptional regulator [Azospirillum picis]|uniref:AcrR family transcriptional regulator n=1 Tax=Azospirillum picis TaxID=488438 RepID=A0ABU0MGD3_9PROT|nr:TetR family transcriptional regulator [Azospirillum picis]MBP2298662.1 AcrR family transcriptional regulator [Azospirillum picis]MDQ0532289.1 AcrR family transcriptional regulator [Azospirillum picis]